MRRYLCVILLLLIAACRRQQAPLPASTVQKDMSVFAPYAETSTPVAQSDSGLPARIVAFAKTQIGVPYKYCSMTPEGGFDCSGFVNYVFNHFNIKVPRSSVEFTYVGENVALGQCRPGDLILFTGTNPHSRTVGHIGIITANNKGDITFIQSTSGAAYGVVVSPLDKNSMARFVKVVRVVN